MEENPGWNKNKPLGQSSREPSQRKSVFETRMSCVCSAWLSRSKPAYRESSGVCSHGLAEMFRSVYRKLWGLIAEGRSQRRQVEAATTPCPPSPSQVDHPPGIEMLSQDSWQQTADQEWVLLDNELAETGLQHPLIILDRKLWESKHYSSERNVTWAVRSPPALALSANEATSPLVHALLPRPWHQDWELISLLGPVILKLRWVRV